MTAHKHLKGISKAPTLLKKVMFQNREFSFICFIHYSLIKLLIGEVNISLRTADAGMRVISQRKATVNCGRGHLGIE